MTPKREINPLDGLVSIAPHLFGIFSLLSLRFSSFRVDMEPVVRWKRSCEREQSGLDVIESLRACVPACAASELRPSSHWASRVSHYICFVDHISISPAAVVARQDKAVSDCWICRSLSCWGVSCFPTAAAVSAFALGMCFAFVPLSVDGA